MIIFWILAGGLVAIALAFILIPLLSADRPIESPAQDALNLEVFRQRVQELDADLASGFLDQGQYDAARHDLERDLLHDLDGQTAAATAAGSAASRWLLAGVLLIGVPAASLYFYLSLGVPELIDRLQAAPMAQSAEGTDAAGQQAMPSMDELIARLEERLKKEPENLDGWLMLGRTYFATARPENGLAAVERAYKLAPGNPDVMLAYAEAIAAASPNRSLEGRPAELIQAALDKAPNSPAARWLTGMVAFQRGDFQRAIDGWQKILTELDPASDEAKNLRKMIDEAHSRGLGAQSGSAESPLRTGAADAVPGAESKETAAAVASIQVDVTLDAALAAQARPEDSVFVFARAASGPKMPLAVKRLQVKDLPARVTLDDSAAMTPQMRLSTLDQVVVGARISKTGEAMPQSGDFEAESGVLKRSNAAKVEININLTRP